MNAEHRPPGRPRSEEVDRAIRVATIGLLHDEGFRGLSMADVATRAGVAKTTLYRRFPTKAHLVLGAGELEIRNAARPDTGDTREDIHIWLSAAAAYQNQTAWSKVIAALAAEPLTEDIADERRLFWRRRFEELTEIFSRGIERGELREDLDPYAAVEFALGPIYLRSLVSGEPLTQGFVEDLVEEVMRYASR